uniref:Uncharacterized protein n=1 Tax=Anguilla anguilla TaxID=7936 RepID=A0A0E9WQA9_ANGAN
MRRKNQILLSISFQLFYYYYNMQNSYAITCRNCKAGCGLYHSPDGSTDGIGLELAIETASYLVNLGREKVILCRHSETNHQCQFSRLTITDSQTQANSLPTIYICIVWSSTL